MRDIKFRGKMIVDGSWIYGSLWIKNGKSMIYFHDGSYAAWIDVDPVTVGQYTDLKDRRITEIYEGDVLNVSNQLRGVVEFESGSFIVQFDDRNVRLAETLPEYDSELIGNIYDNPELLQGVQ